MLQLDQLGGQALAKVGAAIAAARDEQHQDIAPGPAPTADVAGMLQPNQLGG